jgi:HSP20 family protein
MSNFNTTTTAPASSGTGSCCGGAAGSASRPSEIFHPQCDAHQAGEDLVIVADMPGAAADSIDVTFDRGILTLRGRVTRRTPKGLAEEAVLLNEYGVGDYYRTFRVGAPVEPAGITATYAAGVLTVRLPQHESARQRRIPVMAK